MRLIQKFLEDLTALIEVGGKVPDPPSGSGDSPAWSGDGTEWRDWKLLCDQIATQRDEWKRLFSVVAEQRDMLANALRALLDYDTDGTGVLLTQVEQDAAAALAALKDN